MTRTLSGARARQLRRRAHRAGHRNTVGPPPEKPMRVIDEAWERQRLGDLRNQRGRLQTLLGRVDEQIRRLERDRA